MLFGGGLVERGEFFKPLRQFRAGFGKGIFVAPNIGVDLVVLKICCDFAVEQRGKVGLVQGLGYFGGVRIGKTNEGVRWCSVLSAEGVKNGFV